MPDQPDKLHDRRRQSSAITGDGVSVEDAFGVIITFCRVLNGLKWALLKVQHGGQLLQCQNPELHS